MQLTTFGGRGFSIWDPSQLGAPVYDSEGSLEEYMEAETQNQADIKLTPGKEFYLTYDEYYNNKEHVVQDQSRIKIGAGGMIEKSLTYEQFVEVNKSENIYDNDLLE